MKRLLTTTKMSVGTKNNTPTLILDDKNYKSLEELTFTDLYQEIPEEDFSCIRETIEAGVKWLHKNIKNPTTFPKSADRHHIYPA